MGIASNERWDIRTINTPERNAASLAKAVESMLRISKTIIFVDPYFRAGHSSKREPMCKYLNEVFMPNYPEPLRIKIHCSIDFDTYIGSENFKKECNDHLCNSIANGHKVRFIRWTQKDGGPRLHNRYILKYLYMLINPIITVIQ